MKVLIVSNMYPNQTNPQYGVFVKNTEIILKENKILVDKVVMNKSQSKLTKIINYMKFYLLSFVKCIINDYDYIYIHYISHSSLGVLFAKSLKKKLNIISNIHGSDLVPENKKQKRFEKFTQLSILKSEKVIVPSNYYKDLLLKKFNYDSNNIYVFPSGGIDSNVFYPIEDKKSAYSYLNIDETHKYIGYVGRLDYQKGWDIFLESIKLLQEKDLIENYKFIFVGNGKYQEEFINKVYEYNLENKIIHINFMKQEELKCIYNILEAFCFPTMRIGESLGLVGIEALACGVPVIASDFAGPREYVCDNYNGFLFEKGSEVDLAQKIHQFISLSEIEKEKLKKNAYLSSKVYEVSNLKQKLKDIFY